MFATDVVDEAQRQAHTIVGRGFRQPGLSVTLRKLPSLPDEEPEEFPIPSERLSVNDDGTELLVWARVGLEPGQWEIEVETQYGVATHPFTVVAQTALESESNAGWYYPLQRCLDPPLERRTMYITTGWLARHPDYDPIPGRMLAHLGVDLRAPQGTEVYAIGEGLVRDVQGPGAGWGEENIALAIEHQSVEGPFVAVYGHIEATSVPVGLGRGDDIRRGQEIGVTGPLGTGSHLHFVIHPDPENFPDYGWGRIESSMLDDDHFTRGFVDPLHWMETVSPTKPLSDASRLGDLPVYTPFTVRPELKNPREAERIVEEQYPHCLKQAGITGTVKVSVFIDANGRVQNAQVHTSSGHGTMDEAAVEAALQFEFTPALNRDQSVPVWIAVPVRFEER